MRPTSAIQARVNVGAFYQALYPRPTMPPPKPGAVMLKPKLHGSNARGKEIAVCAIRGISLTRMDMIPPRGNTKSAFVSLGRR